MYARVYVVYRSRAWRFIGAIFDCWMFDGCDFFSQHACEGFQSVEAVVWEEEAMK